LFGACAVQPRGIHKHRLLNAEIKVVDLLLKSSLDEYLFVVLFCYIFNSRGLKLISETNIT
jgi:hypothetical protein